MRARVFLSALLIISFLFGCTHKSQKTEPADIRISRPAFPPPAPPDPAQEALRSIQKQYRSEFEELAFPRPGKNPAFRAVSMKCKGFPKTQWAIRSFAAKFGTNSPEYAHLTILKGLIYLHSERFQSAQAIEPEMMKAAMILCSHPSADRLVAQNYNHLVTGWSIIYKHQENLKAMRTGKPFPFRKADFKKLQRAADQIYENLLSQAAADPRITADSESDLYGLHIAAVTAVFYNWVQNSRGHTKKRNSEKEKAMAYERGRKLIGLFLTDAEKRSLLRGRAADPGAPRCRMPYLSWYAWLSSKCTNERPEKVALISSPRF